MSTTITVPAQSVNTITAEILAISKQTSQIVVMSAIRIGGLLTQAKELVPTGEWGSYLKDEVNFSHRSANNFMRLFQEWQRNPNSQALANMSYTKAIRLLSLDEESRTELLEQRDVAAMSSRELDQVIKERDEERAARESVEAENLTLQQALQDANLRASSAKASEDNWREAIDKLKKSEADAIAQRDKARGQVEYMKQHPEIPKAMKDKLIADAKAQGVKVASADFQKQLADAQKKLDDAIAARSAAEQDAQSIRKKLESIEKSAKVANPDVANFMFMFSQIQDDMNKLNGLRLKIKASDPDIFAKLTKALQDMLDNQRHAIS